MHKFLDLLGASTRRCNRAPIRTRVIALWTALSWAVVTLAVGMVIGAVVIAVLKPF